MAAAVEKVYPASNDANNIIDIDVALVTKIRENRDGPAFTMLISKYKNTVYAFCLRYTGNWHDAEDVAQEVFIKIYKNIKQFREESKFSTWLYKITINACRNYVRWRKRFSMPGTERISGDETSAGAEIRELRSDTADPERLLLNKELGFIIRKSVARLGGKQRSIVILRDFLGKSYEEIGAIMDMNTGTVKSTLSRGRLSVAREIRGYDTI